MTTFGASAPYPQLQARFGFTPDAVAEVARQQLRRHGRTVERRAS
ncbi:hypothetical protein [Pseudonocardia nigra]|nr:hypothetical protein [Pseudonocardia nigra]